LNGFTHSQREGTIRKTATLREEFGRPEGSKERVQGGDENRVKSQKCGSGVRKGDEGPAGELEKNTLSGRVNEDMARCLGAVFQEEEKGTEAALQEGGIITSPKEGAS